MEKFKYFQSYENNFWQWEEEGGVVSIPRGSTIAYKSLLQEIIPPLSVQPLPPFGSILLSIIATNPNGKEVLNELDRYFNTQEDGGELWSEAKGFLLLLASMPEEFKIGAKKIQLFQTIFEQCHHNVSRSKTLEAKSMLKSGEVWADCLKPKKTHLKIARKDLNVFRVLSLKFGTVQQILAKITALPEVPDINEVLEATIKDEEISIDELLEQLIANDQTRSVGSLVRHLWGALNIPFHSYLPSSQPLGGISDLTNKGDLDKILISEFANDDLVFLSRLANNEALFIQREIPPQKNELERIVLIDTSIKNWGTPKTLAYALLLAISKHPKTDIPCKAFAVGENFEPINFQSVHTLIDALNILNPRLNSANGLMAFLSDSNLIRQKEIFIITEKSIPKQAEMVKILNDFHQAITYWIYTDADGIVEIYKKQQQTKRLLQHFKLPLNDLWKAQTNPKREEYTSNILDYPILFPTPNKYKILADPFGVIRFLISNDFQLFSLTDKTSNKQDVRYTQKGVDLLWSKVPPNCDYILGTNSNNDTVLASVDVKQNHVSLINLRTQKEQTAFFDKNSISKGVLRFQNNCFYYRSFKGNWIINPNNGDVKLDPNPVEFPAASLSREIPFINPSRNVLRRINSIAISDQHSLIFNEHELKLNESSQTVTISNRKNPNKMIVSKQRSVNEFVFPDSSIVEVNFAGMVILKSSNSSIPLIFIPTVLETRLGMATMTEFAGNDFFKKTEKESIGVIQFSERYMKPFLKNIIAHGA